MKEILENNFQQVYDEYKKYESFFAPKIKTVEERRKELATFINENKEDTELVLNKVFEEGTKFLFHERDLQNLRTKLFNTYKAVEGVIDIPKEVVKEITDFKIENQYYIINNNEEIPLNEEFMSQIKESIRRDYSKILEEALKSTSE